MNNRIIVIDGDEHQRGTLVHFLADKGYQTLGLGSYGQALEFIKRDVVDIVVTDFFIGKNSAAGLCEFVRKNYADHVALIVYCDPPTAETERRIRQYSPAFLFVKPVISEDIHAVISRITRSIEQHQAGCVTV